MTDKTRGQRKQERERRKREKKKVVGKVNREGGEREKKGEWGIERERKKKKKKKKRTICFDTC